MHILIDEESGTDIEITVSKGVVSIYDTATGGTLEVAVNQAVDLAELIIAASNEYYFAT